MFEYEKMEQFLSRIWFIVNEKVAYNEIIDCANAVQLRNVGMYLWKIKCKWENKIGNI
jgi:hypothetical protein